MHEAARRGERRWLSGASRITGLGLVTPIGIGKEAFWNALLAGRVGVGEITRFDASTYPSRMAAEIRDFDASQYMDRRRMQWTDRFSQLAVVAALLACEDAGITIEGRSDVGVYTGSALGGLTYAEEQLVSFQKEGLRAVRPLLTLSVFGGAAPSNVAIQLGLHGPTIANADSCAAGAIAIGDAFRAIRRGELSAAIAGGVEAPLAPLTYGAFTVARAMSTRNDDPGTASRPFDRERDGFVMGEGAGLLVLENYDDAVSRGARIYAEITGFGTTNDAHHMAAPARGRFAGFTRDGGRAGGCVGRRGRSRGDQRARLFDAARRPRGDSRVSGRLRRTRLAHSDQRDERAARARARRDRRVGGGDQRATLSEGRLPAAVNFAQADEGYEIDCTRNVRDVTPRIVLSNSSGFGGINAALVLRAAAP